MPLLQLPFIGRCCRFSSSIARSATATGALRPCLSRAIGRPSFSPGQSARRQRTNRCHRGSPIRALDIFRTILRSAQRRSSRSWPGRNGITCRGGERRPATAALVEGWSIPKPDLILKMPQPVLLPASGDIEYTYEIVPTHFAEDRWVQMAEVLPGLRSNVHHGVVYIRPPDSHWLWHAPVGVPFTASALSDPEDRRGAHWTDSDVLLVYAPGSSPDEWSAKMAKFIPAGSDLVFQMHYTTNGHAGSDQTIIGLIFSKQVPEQRVLTLQLTNDHFLIPPGDQNYRVEARGTLPNDATLLSFLPHMHLRGIQFEYNIVHRNGAVAGKPVYEI